MHRRDALPQIIHEIDRFYDIVVAEYDRQFLLRICGIWSLQFTKVILDIAGSQERQHFVASLVDKVFTITKKSRDRSIPLCYKLWSCLATKPETLSVDEFVTNVIATLVSYLAQEYTVAEQRERDICQGILSSVAESSVCGELFGSS